MKTLLGILLFSILTIGTAIIPYLIGCLIFFEEPFINDIDLAIHNWFIGAVIIFFISVGCRIGYNL